MYGFHAILPSFEALAYSLNLALAVTVVSGGGLAVAWGCRHRSTPLRHGVLVGTLLLLLLSPAAIGLAQNQGFGMLRVTLASPPEKSVTPQSKAGESARVPASWGAAERSLPEPARFRASTPVEGSVSASVHAAESLGPAPTTVARPENPAFPAWWQVVACVAMGLWALGTGVGLVRLSRGYLALARFCRQLTPLLDPRQQGLVQQAARAVGLRRVPAVFLSPGASVPVSIGLRRPAIVLPEALPRQVEEEQLQAVLVHEMAHLVRRDPWVGLAQRLAALLFWWHPWVHRTCEEISELREEICDNHVVLVQGEGRRLACLLVDLATRVAGSPLLPSTVGVLEPKLAGLTGRVTRLLEKDRNMDTRMDLRSKVLLVSGTLLVLTGMAVFGGLQLAYAQSAAAPAAIDAEAKNADQFDFRGQVLDPEGKPLQDAKIYFVFYANFSHPEREPLKVQATSGADGRFHFTLAKAEFEAWRAAHPLGIFTDVNFRNDCRLVAQADGYGPIWLPAYAFDASGELRARILQVHPQDAEALNQTIEPVLRLVKDDVPLEGRIVDPQGKPVAGVQVRITCIMPVIGEDLTGWLEIAEKEGADFCQTLRHFSCALVPHAVFTDGFLSSSELPQIADPATSDAEGKIRLTGIGRERLVDLSIEGPGIETPCSVIARTRPGRTLVLPYRRPFSLGMHTFYGATFEHVAPPSLPIVGTVRDKDTGKPLAGVTIQAHKLTGNASEDFVVRHFLHTTTDEQGNYRLTGMPLGRGNEVLVVPSADQPYLLSRKVVDTSAGQGKDALRLDLELKRGIWIRGKVTDAKTGAPVRSCLVEYVTFADNPACQSAPGFEGAYQFGLYETDPEGRYAVRGLPGRGIVVVRAGDEGESRYMPCVGAEKIPEVRAADGILKNVLPQELHIENKHAFAEVNPAEGAESIPLDFQLDPGQTLTGTVLDPEGKPLCGAHYDGLQGLTPWEQLSTATFTVNSYRPDQGRQLRFVHLERKLAGSRLLKGDVEGPLSVQLEPWGVLTGRIVDAEGKPLAGVEIRGENLPEYLRVREANGLLHNAFEIWRTDEEGRFRIEGLAPGVKLSLGVMNPRSGHSYHMQPWDVPIEAGKTRDIGDWSAEPPKPATK